MKVAFLALAPFISGSERSLQMILSNCDYANIDAILIAPKNSPMHQWAADNEIKSYSCELEYISVLKHPIRWFVLQLKLFRILKKEHIEVVHSNQLWSYSIVAKVARLLNIKRVCHFRDEINESCNWWLTSGLELGICISKHIKKQLQQSVNPGVINRIEVIINPVKIDHAIPNDTLVSLRKNAKEIYNISAYKMVFGYIGQIAPIKGVTEMLRVLARIENEDWCLILAGDDPSPDKSYLKQCKQLVNELSLASKVHFLGFIEDVKTFYHAVDIVLVFSEQEPLGRIPLEAGAFGIPCIATSVGGLPETVIDGETGWLIPPEMSVNEKANFIDAIVKSDLTKAGSAARNWVEEIADPKAYITKLSKLYNITKKQMVS